MKPKIKAVLLYSYQYEDADVLTDLPPAPNDRLGKSICRPSFVLDADAESYDAMVEPMAESLSRFSRYVWKNVHPDIREDFRVQVRTVLKAIGITRPKSVPSRRGK